MSPTSYQTAPPRGTGWLPASSRWFAATLGEGGACSHSASTLSTTCALTWLGGGPFQPERRSGDRGRPVAGSRSQGSDVKYRNDCFALENTCRWASGGSACRDSVTRTSRRRKRSPHAAQRPARERLTFESTRNLSGGQSPGMSRWSAVDRAVRRDIPGD